MIEETTNKIVQQDTPVTLGYWAIRGLAERIRQLLEYTGIKYNEEKYDGATGRAKWFNEVKPSLIDKNSALTLPYLIDGDKVISESEAICIYICYKAKKEQLLGRNIDEKVTLATAYGVYKDFHPYYIRLVYGNYNQNNTFEKQLEEVTKDFEVYMKKLNGILGKKQFMCGQLTWVDFAFGDFFQCLYLLKSELFVNFPNLKAYQERVWALPELQNYFKSDRFHERPCNNYTATWK